MNLQKEWKNVTREIHNKPDCRTPYPKTFVLMRELLLVAQVILEKIERGQNRLFNKKIYKKVMAEYYHQKLLFSV